MSRPLAEIVGRVVGGRYRMETLLGRGGVGAVYEAEQLDTQTPVALKILLPNLANATQVAERFKREIKAVSLLAHPNIVQVLDAVVEGEDIYLVMEVLRGVSLAETLEQGALAPRRALVLARQMLEALEHAHGRGVIHRDLKPSNVMLVKAAGPGGSEIERVKLLDFGLAKLVGDTAAALGDSTLTNTGIVFGTPAYLAPEQALGRIVDARSDLYSAGTLVFEMLTGRTPYRSPDPVTLTRMQASAPVPTLASVAPNRPWCTRELEALIARSLAKQPADRFANATAMIAALDAAFVSLDHLG